MKLTHPLSFIPNSFQAFLAEADKTMTILRGMTGDPTLMWGQMSGEESPIQPMYFSAPTESTPLPLLANLK